MIGSRPALLALVVLAACGPKPRRDYLRVYERHTEHLLVYESFETALNMRATYLTDPMRVQIAEERKRLLGEAAPDDGSFMRDLLADGEVYHEVVFSADSALPEGEDFGTTDLAWRLQLHADGKPEKLVTVYEVRTPNPMQRALYPHFNRWSDLWVARFEKTVPSPTVVELFVGSGYGNGQLRWELDGD